MADTMSPPRTGVMTRTAIRRACDSILNITNTDEPTLAEIEEIQPLCQIISLYAKKWRTAEALIIEANRRDR